MTDIVTPNIKEASVLLGDVPLKSVSDMRTAAKLIHDMGPRFVSFNLLEYFVPVLTKDFLPLAVTNSYFSSVSIFFLS